MISTRRFNRSRCHFTQLLDFSMYQAAVAIDWELNRRCNRTSPIEHRCPRSLRAQFYSGAIFIVRDVNNCQSAEKLFFSIRRNDIYIVTWAYPETVARVSNPKRASKFKWPFRCPMQTKLQLKKLLVR